jgi:CubicO group peptidase (beta-lactamase class C family)
MKQPASAVSKRIPGRHLTGLLLLLAVMVGLFSQPVSAARFQSGSIDFPAIDAYLQAQMKKHDLPGAALAVIEGEEIIYLKGYGRTGDGQAVTPQTQMYIGSQTKSFTALAISQLAEAGQIDLDAPLRTYVPWFEVADPQASGLITIRHLLHHTSGLSEAGFNTLLKDDASLEECVRALKNARQTAPLGSKFQYFNYGYDVLGYIIEQVSGQSYASYIQANILDPLQMAHTTADPLHAPGLSTGFTRIFGLNVPLKEPPNQPDIPAGYIVSTVEDMAHYVIAMNHQGEYRGAKLLSDQGMRALFRPQLDGYAMGWNIGSSFGTTHISHGGANRTFHTYVDLYPNRDRGFVLIVNQGSQPDHFVSASQLFLGLDALVLGHNPPPIDQGMNVRWIGWGLLVLVLALIALHTWNFYQLRTWPARAQKMTLLRLIWDVAISFLLPSIIMTVVIIQVKAFYGYRFNPVVQMQQVFRMIPEVSLLILMGTLPDIVQGLIKLYWVVSGRVRPTRKPFAQVVEVAEGS